MSKKPATKSKAKSKTKAAHKRSVPAGTSAKAESGSEDAPILKRPAAAPKRVAAPKTAVKAKAKNQARKYWYYADKKIGIKYDGHERMTVVVSDQFQMEQHFCAAPVFLSTLQQINLNCCRRSGEVT